MPVFSRHVYIPGSTGKRHIQIRAFILNQKELTMAAALLIAAAHVVGGGTEFVPARTRADPPLFLVAGGGAAAVLPLPKFRRLRLFADVLFASCSGDFLLFLGFVVFVDP